ncbi:MAG TPA: transposase [Anaerolineae bacterium]
MSNRVAKHLASIPPGTLLAGVDLSLDDLVVVVLNATANRLDRFRSDNHAAGYADFRQRLQRTVEKQGASGVWVGMEPTNYYWKQLGYDLEQHQIPFWLVNALTVKRHREGDQLDRSKDDWRDAFTIVDLLRQGKFTETRLPHGVYAELQTGYTAYQRLRRDRGRQATLLVNAVRQLFPEFEQVFKDVTGATARAVIGVGLAPHVICTHAENTFVASVCSQFTEQRLSVRQVRRLYALAARSYGSTEATHALRQMAQQHAQMIELLDAQAEQLLQALLTLFETLPEAPYLLSIQGLTAPSALGLVAYTGDLTQYPHGSALIKLAGTQPTPNTSGRKTYSPTPFSHQGRSGLRTVVYFITLRLITQNDALHYHYQRLTTRAEHPLPKNLS